MDFKHKESAERTDRPIREDIRSFSQHNGTISAVFHPCLLKTTTFSLKDFSLTLSSNFHYLTDSLANLGKFFAKNNIEYHFTLAGLT